MVASNNGKIETSTLQIQGMSRWLVVLSYPQKILLSSQQIIPEKETNIQYQVWSIPRSKTPWVYFGWFHWGWLAGQNRTHQLIIEQPNESVDIMDQTRSNAVK